MRKIYFLLMTLGGIMLYTSCNSYETYSDLKEKERDAIARFIADSAINVISESTFTDQGETTDVSKNQYVYLEKSGVYMQIIRKGCGSPIEDGATVEVLNRFLEYNIKLDSMLIRNDIYWPMYNSSTDVIYDASMYLSKMSVQRTGSIYTASFVSGLMMMYHSSTSSVPAGWLVPLQYINVGRPEKEGDEVAKVRLIVPHSQGTADASSSVYPCYYEITYERDV